MSSEATEFDCAGCGRHIVKVDGLPVPEDGQCGMCKTIGVERATLVQDWQDGLLERAEFELRYAQAADADGVIVVRRTHGVSVQAKPIEGWTQLRPWTEGVRVDLDGEEFIALWSNAEAIWFESADPEPMGSSFRRLFQ